MTRLLFFLITTVMTLTLVLTSCSAAEEPLEPNQYRVTYYYYMISNNSVGNDWMRDVTCDGVRVRSGDVLTLSNSFSFRCKITEDDTSPDVGYKTVSFTGLQIGEKQERTVRIVITEDKGRYAGNTATWEVTVTVERLS